MGEEKGGCSRDDYINAIQNTIEKLQRRLDELEGRNVQQAPRVNASRPSSPCEQQMCSTMVGCEYANAPRRPPLNTTNINPEDEEKDKKKKKEKKKNKEPIKHTEIVREEPKVEDPKPATEFVGACGKCSNPKCTAQCIKGDDPKCKTQKCKDLKKLEAQKAKELKKLEAEKAKEKPPPINPVITIPPAKEQRHPRWGIIVDRPEPSEIAEEKIARKLDIPQGVNVSTQHATASSPPAPERVVRFRDKKMERQTQTAVTFGTLNVKCNTKRPYTAKQVERLLKDIVQCRDTNDIVITAVSWTSSNNLVVNVIDKRNDEILGCFDIKDWTFHSAHKLGVFEKYDAEYLVHYPLSKVECQECKLQSMLHSQCLLQRQ